MAFETAFLWPFFHFNIPLLERLGAAFLSKKVEILIFCFLFFFSSSRPVITFNCQKSAFLVPTQGTSKLFCKKYYWIFRFRRPELSSKFLFFVNFESFFVLLWVPISKCQSVKNWIFGIRVPKLSSKFWFFLNCLLFCHFEFLKFELYVGKKQKQS